MPISVCSSKFSEPSAVALPIVISFPSKTLNSMTFHIQSKQNKLTTEYSRLHHHISCCKLVQHLPFKGNIVIHLTEPRGYKGNQSERIFFKTHIEFPL